MKQPFEGINILDLSWAGVGPMTTLCFANHGATVVRIESMLRPGPERTLAPYKDFKPGVNRSGNFAQYMRNRYSLALNFNHPKAPELIKRFVSWADIATEAFVPGFLSSKGLGYEELWKIKPDIIMFHTSMQGSTGPNARARGLGFILTSLSGIANFTGWPDKEPSPPLGAFTDYLAPWLSACAVIGALDYRNKTGKGMDIDQSQLESIMHYVLPRLLDYQINGRDQRVGNASDQACPNGVFPCKGQDSWCAISVTSDDEWKAFCDVVGNTNLMDEKFSNMRNRKANEDELNSLVAAWTIGFDAKELMFKLQSEKVPAGMVSSPEDIYQCPQLEARQYWCFKEVMELGLFPIPGEPFRLSRAPLLDKLPPPVLGEHTEFVCTKIFGMSQKEFDTLLVDGLFT
jgi:benzylsuccinate CoA-transferase BbsF subunit